MSDLTDFRTKVLNLLSDTGNAIFSNDNVDQALRWALSEFSFHRPLIRTYLFIVEATTRIHGLSTDFITRQITNVQLYNDDFNLIIDVPFYAYLRDESWVIETRDYISAGETLQISYSAIHTIDSLDSASGTTIVDADEPIIHIGAAGRAAQMRALDRIETINMNPQVAQLYRLLAGNYLTVFTRMTTKEDGVIFSLPDFPAADTF